VKRRFASINKSRSFNIMDNMIRMMEKYANNLEEVVSERTRQLVEEKKKSDSLLYRLLPASVADTLKSGASFPAQLHPEATVYFSDVVSFTSFASQCTPLEVVDFLNDLWTIFDNIINKYKVYKVETIGDGYMVACGVPDPYKQHASEIANMSLELLAAVEVFKSPHRPQHHLQIRIGFHSGPVVAGIVGRTMPHYCLFGDTVSMASRLEAQGQAQKIHMSEESYKCLNESNLGYVVECRGTLEMKGVGTKTTYWLLDKTYPALLYGNE
jgi:class 3 adenylate cyclase